MNEKKRKLPKREPANIWVHMDLLEGRDELEDAVYAYLYFLNKCPHALPEKKEFLESFGITEEDVKKYYNEWLNTFGEFYESPIF
ncbi:MAG: hypothetical protein N3A69_10875 [Leptospiraceae bacterium]|nr:hypothetical protein [Leptospiraceae bacterium]